MMDILSGNLMDTGELLNKLQRNMSFRVTSARDMVTGIRGESEMSPLQRRRQIRQNRLDLIGMGSDEDMSASGDSTDSDSMNTSSVSTSTDQSSPISQSSTSSVNNSASSTSTSSSTPSMSEVDKGTKSRADDSGFSNVN